MLQLHAEAAPPLPSLDTARVAVIGLGYVGLPLAAAFGRRFPTIGYDVNPRRIEELQEGHDRTREVEPDALKAEQLKFAADRAELSKCNVFLITVPTPVDINKRPDFEPLRRASMSVGALVKPGDVIVFESTVYPGATEEICVPLIEAASGLEFNVDFFVGYSPERANPGDPEHQLSTIVKVVSGSTPETTDFLEALYQTIVPAGVHRTSSIRVAEAAKVIENTQRDLNIALINELAIIFNRLQIDTEEVLAAARTKWNFLPFRPGLVGGHCIGVDPYYLCHKAQAVGYHPEIILAGRRINDGMASYTVTELVRCMIRKRIHVNQSHILMLGLSFKENCPDIRNTRVIDMVRHLQEFGATVDIHDPWVDPDEAEHAYGIRPIPVPGKRHYDAVVLAVAHREFREMEPDAIVEFARDNHVLYDLKNVLPAHVVDIRL